MNLTFLTSNEISNNSDSTTTSTCDYELASSHLTGNITCVCVWLNVDLPYHMWVFWKVYGRKYFMWKVAVEQGHSCLFHQTPPVLPLPFLHSPPQAPPCLPSFPLDIPLPRHLATVPFKPLVADIPRLLLWVWLQPWLNGSVGKVVMNLHSPSSL